MKNMTFFLATIIVLSTQVSSQNYLINFTGSGLSNSVDSVLVVNLPTGDSLMIGGDDTLHLIPVTGIGRHGAFGRELDIFPNPMSQTSKIEFFNIHNGNVELEILDLTGNVVISQKFLLPYGGHIFSVSGLKAGAFLVKVRSGIEVYTARLLSVAGTCYSPQLAYEGQVATNLEVKSGKNTENIIHIFYNEGERLLFKGMAENHARIITHTPTQSTTIDFEFIECVDADGKHYPVVTIGDQTWMAENLAWLPDISPPNQSSFTQPHYYVYGYFGYSIAEAKATENYKNYGTLYNWTAALTACPEGWHLPDDNEWKTLEGNTDSQFGIGDTEWNGMFWRGFDTGKHLKSTSIWLGNGHGNNEFGFTAMPGGFYTTVVPFSFIELYGRWWTAEVFTSTTAWSRTFYSSINNSYRYYYQRSYGCSVRCVKD